MKRDERIKPNKNDKPNKTLGKHSHNSESRLENEVDDGV